MAASMAPWTFSGEPSVATWSTVQPSALAAAARIGPWIAHASTPQLTKVTFLPVGMGLSIGVVAVIVVGRTAALATVALAAARPAVSTYDDEVALLDEPQAEATNRRATTEPAVTIHFARLPVRGCCADMILTFCVCCWTRDGGGNRQVVTASVESSEATGRAASVVRRWMPVTISAAISTTPMNIGPDHCGALARPRPVVPVPSSSTAIMVPPALNRPFLSWVAPRKTAAKPGRRYGVPAVGEPPPRIEASTMPADPARTPDVTSARTWRRATLTPASRAASGLKPTAYRRRPVAVCSRRY